MIVIKRLQTLGCWSHGFHLVLHRALVQRVQFSVQLADLVRDVVQFSTELLIARQLTVKVSLVPPALLVRPYLRVLPGGTGGGSRATRGTTVPSKLLLLQNTKHLSPHCDIFQFASWLGLIQTRFSKHLLPWLLTC